MNEKNLKQLGKPDIQLSGMQIYVHGQQFPDMSDYWDGNWLKVTVHCGAEGASVWVSGPFIHLSELQSWMALSKKLSQNLKGEANLDCMEPELSVTLKAESLGHIGMNVEITPNHLKQQHKFSFELDQSYLPGLVCQLGEVLKKYPIKGENGVS